MTDRLEISADHALFTGKVPGLIVTFHENERPLWGLAGLIDWKLKGILTSQLRSGAIRGVPGECVYYPAVNHGRVYHLILAGAGASENYGKRAKLPHESVQALARNLKKLGIEGLAVSCADFGQVSEDWFKANFKGVKLCVTA